MEIINNVSLIKYAIGVCINKIHCLVLDMHFKKIIFSIVLVLVITSCETIGPVLDNSKWDCGLATSETKMANCEIRAEYLSQSILSNYSGEVRPVNYDQAVPHGSGRVKYKGNYINAKFTYGRIYHADLTFDDGSSFSGNVNEQLEPVSGRFENNNLIYTGSITDWYFDLGKAKWKETSNTFNGTWEINKETDTSVPLVGIYTINGTYPETSDTCKSSVDANFIQTEKGFALYTGAEYKISHPVAKVSRHPDSFNNQIYIKFYDSSSANLKIENPKYSYSDDSSKWLTKIESYEKSLQLNSDDNSINFSTFEWEYPLDCSSYPTFLTQDEYIGPSFFRYVISDKEFNHNELVLAYGFENTNLEFWKSNKDIVEQLLFVKFINKNYERNIVRTFEEESRYVSGQREQWNPKYDEAQFAVQDAYEKYLNAKNEEIDCPYNAEYPIMCAMASAGYETATDNRYREYEAAKNKVSNTSRTVLIDVYSDYSVEKIQIEAKKTATLVAVYMDLIKGETFYKEIPLIEEKEFVVINSEVAETDINKRKLLKNISNENEVDNWMNSNIEYSKNGISILEEIKTNDYILSKTKSAQIKLIDNLVSENKKNVSVSSSKNTSIKKSNDYIVEDSIVIVDTLDGSGTGFYITKNHILTNHHVVEDSNFVNLKNMLNDTFTGKVIAKDISTDLAIIEVDYESRPLQLEPTCKVDRRENVFTVGHPKGFEYSTSRGIVSSIRNIPNPFYKATGKKLYIQIDASISSGNSGGPLFNSDEYVIGVNTWGRTDGQNLNFAVHCSEVQSFIEENL